MSGHDNLKVAACDQVDFYFDWGYEVSVSVDSCLALTVTVTVAGLHVAQNDFPTK